MLRWTPTPPNTHTPLTSLVTTTPRGFIIRPRLGPLPADASPRRRALTVSRAVWKQASAAGDLWEKLTARCVDRHRHMERTLEQLLQAQAAMGGLAGALQQAETVRDAWEPVGDLFIDTLQDHIDATKVHGPVHLPEWDMLL